ncbi:extracellular solute-binding protein [Treponema sp. OMZ 840]|uniref:ABC transporter substrate-binding protein n=1 Tax=Treponema sp. OMZ 840 TaxID=244313 RepID=UPI003D8D98E9
MKKKTAAVLLSVIACTILFVGCKQSKKTSEMKLVFAQDLGVNETANKITEDILQKYKEATGVTIEFKNHESDYRTWLTTQFTAGQGPDVYSGILYEMSSDYEAGYLYNFKDLYEKESPYDPGRPWKATLPDSILERMYVTPTDVPGYPSSTAVVRIFYNKTLFDAAGAKVPATWEEFIDSCKKLKASGTIPFAFPNASKNDLSWLWFNNSVCSQLNSAILSKADVTGNGFVELAEIAKAFDEGILDFTAPQIKEAFVLMKDFSQYWSSDYNGLEQKSAVEMFIRGEAAMVQALSTSLTSISANVGNSFEYGVMPIPVITSATSSYAMGKSVILGGQPDIIYGVNKALEKDPERLKAAIDFAQYMSSSAVQVRYAEELNRIPLSTSTKLPERLAGFIIIEEPLRLPYYTGISGELRDLFCRGGQMYLEGAYSVDKFAQYVQESYAAVLKNIKTEKGWSKENNYGLK